MKKIFQEKKNFYITLLMVLSIFITDKIFLIPDVKKISVSYKKIEIFFYESKRNLFEILRENSNRFYTVILGSSRSGMFTNQIFEKHLPQTKTFNFSAPLAGTSYYYYWLEKIISEISNKPVIVFLELDAINLGEPALRFSLPYSYDPLFMLKHFDFYREDSKNNFSVKGNGFLADEVDSYFIKYFFIISRYDIHPNKIFQNLKKIDYFDSETQLNKKIPLYEFAYIMQKNHLNQMNYSLGGIPNEFYAQIEEKEFKIDAEKYFQRILPEPKLASSQIIFLKKIIEITNKHKIPLLLFNLPMSIFAEEILKKYQLFEIPELIEILKNYNHILYVEGRNISCKQFIDSIHLNPKCYVELTDFIFKKINESNFLNRKIK